jgi:hypothetical protein
MICEQVEISKEVVVACLNILFRLYPGDAGKKYENFEPG